MAVDKLMSIVPTHRRLDQNEAPIVEAIRDYLERDPAPFLIPAHKQGRSLDPFTLDALGADTYRHDIGMLNGLDDIHESREIQIRAQDLFADLVGADQSFYLVNGSTLSVQCAIMAVARPGEKLLVARNSHKSVFSGLIVGGIEPVWLEPEFDDELDVAHGLDPDAVARALDEHPDARGVVAVSPSYYGVASDLRGIADACHAHGVPLIADDAWGAHFPFHDDLPDGSLASGSDIAIASFHKTLTGLQQASVLSIQGDLVDSKLISDRIGLVETSSVSSAILASMDAARRGLALHGEEALTRTLELARRARMAIDALPGLDLMGREVLGRCGAHDLDETKLTIDVSGLGTHGFAVCDWLRNEHGVLVELADSRRILATFTIADDDTSLERLLDALRALTRNPDAVRTDVPDTPQSSELQTQLIMAPRDAYFADAEYIELEEAEGRIAAEKVTPYPPGVPVLVPGERVARPIVAFLRSIVAMGATITDVADPQLDTIRVVA
jgi:arginine decarboxylase